MATETFVVSVGKPTIVKDPNAVLDYTLDWSEWLEPLTDTIASVAVAVTGVTLDHTTNDGTSVTIWVSGGTVGTPGSARVRITTVGTGARPRTDDRTVYFKIKER